MKIKILQWNVWIRENPNKIAAEILKLNPDIFCVQELKQNLADGEDFADTIAKATNYHFVFDKSSTWDNRSDITSQGNAIFSKYPILESKHYFLKPFKHNPKNAAEEGRIYSEILIKPEDRLLTVGTTHLSYSYKLRNTKRRKEEFKVLSELLETKNRDFVFTGDLNTSPKSFIVNNLPGNLINAGPNFNENTWPTKPFNYHNFKEDKLNWRLDYIFTTKDIKVIKSEIVKTSVSDHLPILIEIEF